MPLTDPDIGPKVSRAEVEKVEAITADPIAAGAEVLLRGGPLREGAFAKGHWIAPTVLRANDNALPVMRDEIFGPVVAALASVLRVRCTPRPMSPHTAWRASPQRRWWGWLVAHPTPGRGAAPADHCTWCSR